MSNRIVLIASIAFCAARISAATTESVPDAAVSGLPIFAEPLIPIGGVASDAENADLRGAVQTFANRSRNEDFQSLTGFLATHPGSRWKASLLLQLGLVHYHTGYFSRAIADWEEAWKLSKSAKEPLPKAVADEAVGELAKMYARLGRYESLETLFKEIEGRDIRGPATEKITGAREGLWLMDNKPENAFRCGPFALGRIRALSNPASAADPLILNSRSTRKGISLDKVQALSLALKMPYQMAKRRPGALIRLPAVVHWKVGHYAALVRSLDGRYLIQDPTFGQDIWISPEALDAEASGYFLVPAGPLGKGWSKVGVLEARSVFGKGATSSDDPDGTKPGDSKTGGNGGKHNDGEDGEPGDGDGGPGKGPPPGCGMAVYTFHSMLASLNITDMPLGYRPPVGPAVHFRVTYNQREAGQPAIFNYSNLGPKWTLDWLSYITDDPLNASGDVSVFPRGGGTEHYKGFNSATKTWDTYPESRAQLVRTATSPITYERRMPDGSKQLYTKANGATTFPRKIFLTKIIDPAGNAQTYAYDGTMRLTSVTDALGQVTTLAYAFAADPLKPTQVTDPFGRFAKLEYNAAGQLIKITDVLGLTSEFTYGTSDFILTLKTGYGITSFSAGDNGPGRMRFIQATDAMGQKERLEFRAGAPGTPVGGDPIGTPTGMSQNIIHLNDPATYYWDKKAMEFNPGDYTKAVMYNWLRSTDLNATAGILNTVKSPLENRVWYNYQGHSGPAILEGMISRPAKIGRILDDGSSQVWQYEYNPLGGLTKYIDPLNRTTIYGYAANNIDLLTVNQLGATANELLETRTYNSLHEPLTIKDVAGQTTTFTYNSKGQVLTAKNAKNETTTYLYGATGYLTKVTGAQLADSTVYSYDSFGRVASIRYHDGYILAYQYDALDRLTKITYPDGTFRQYVFNRLDLEQNRDRLGRWTKTVFNAVRQPVAYQDALGRTTNMDWCGCGSIGTLTDPAGKSTTWKRDIEGRVIEKQFADGKKIQYAYEAATGRLSSITDAKGQVKKFTYLVDDNIQKTDFTNALIPTASVSLTYDAVYNRVKTMTDGTGLTTYGYNAVVVPAALGAGRLASVDGPLASDVISYAYDALGRVTNRGINGVNATYAFDNLGRETNETNALGAFTYKYVGVTDRLDSLIYPNGQKNKYSYATNTGDFRLAQIKDLTPALAVLSQYDYTYDVEGQIKSWTQKSGTATASIHNFAYDAADQVVGDEVKSAATGNPVTKGYAYAYDLSGNRTSTQENGAVNTFAYNNLNELTGQSAGGKVRFFGSVNEPATVTLNGASADVSAAKKFDGTLSLPAGTSTVSVTAKDYSNNSATAKYQVTTSGSAATFTYDNNGNQTGDGTRTYEWDAENRLTAIVNGALRSEFTYDGLSRRVHIVEKNGTTVTADIRLLWVGNQIAEERNSAGSTVNKKYFGQGVLVGATKFFYARDHLGSIRDMTDNAGAVGAHYDYDPWGNRTRTVGTQNADFGFTGHYLHTGSGLYLTKYRAYSPALGRWISRDPVEEEDGPNLYAYVRNSPINRMDRLGLQTGAFALPAPNPSWGPAGMFCLGVAGAGVWVWEQMSSGGGGDDSPPRQRSAGGPDAVPDPTKAAPGDATSTPNKNPYTGAPGAPSTTYNPDGTPKQVRTYGEDGYPATDTDYNHDHGQGTPHIHDWGRPSGGGKPTKADRGPGKQVQ